MTEQNEKLTLEEMFRNLDQVVEELGNEEITLEKSFELYKSGMDMLKQCNETIDTVEKKVQMLDENGGLHEF